MEIPEKPTKHVGRGLTLPLYISGERAVITARQELGRAMGIAPEAVRALPAPTTTGWRIGCRPPSHSHWSEMHDHTRLEISCATDWRGSRG